MNVAVIGKYRSTCDCLVEVKVIVVKDERGEDIDSSFVRDIDCAAVGRSAVCKLGISN